MYWCHPLIRESIAAISAPRDATPVVPLVLAHRRIGADRAAAGCREIEAGEAEQDRRGAAIEQRQEHRRLALEHVAHEVGEGHLTRQDESAEAGEQTDHQERAEHELECTGRVDDRRDVREVRQHRKLEQFCDAVLEQQEAGDEAKQAQENRLKANEIGKVHWFVPSIQCATWTVFSSASQAIRIISALTLLSCRTKH